MSFTAISFWRRKRPFSEINTPSRCAFRVCGFEPDESVLQAVAALSELCLMTGYERPVDKRPLGAFGAGQGSRHRGWKFPGLTMLLKAGTPEDFYVRAKQVLFPLDGIKPSFPADLQDL